MNLYRMRLARATAAMTAFAFLSAGHAQNAPAAPAQAPAAPAPAKAEDGAPPPPPVTPDAVAATAAAKKVEFERLPNGDVCLGGITVHRTARTVSFAATVNQAAGPIEVLIGTPNGRLHESFLCADIKALHLQTLLYLLDLKNGPRFPDANGNQGSILDISLEYKDKAGKTIQEPIENWIRDNRVGKSMFRYGWVFTGSSINEGAFLADVGGNLVITFSPADTILELPDKTGDSDMFLELDPGKTEPGKGAAVRVILTPREKKP